MVRNRRRLDVPLDHRAAHQLAPSGAGGAVAMMPEETVRSDSELPRHRGGQRGKIGGGIAQWPSGDPSRRTTRWKWLPNEDECEEVEVFLRGDDGVRWRKSSRSRSVRKTGRRSTPRPMT
jgi:hypothetical protein